MEVHENGAIVLLIKLNREISDAKLYISRARKIAQSDLADLIEICAMTKSAKIRSVLSRATVDSLLAVPAQNEISKTMNSVSHLLSRTGLDIQRRRNSLSSMDDYEIEAALSDLFDYLGECLKTMNEYMNRPAFTATVEIVWDQVLEALQNILLPSMKVTPSRKKPVPAAGMEVVFKWLKFLKDFFHANGEGLSLELLENDRYREFCKIRTFYNLDTDKLIRECERCVLVKRSSEHDSSADIQLIINNRLADKSANLGDEMILRILRMRPGTEKFLMDRFRQRRRLATGAAAEALVSSSLAVTSRKHPSKYLMNTQRCSLKHGAMIK